MKKDLKHISKTIADYFRTQPIIKAYLFGSFARGEESADSDLDVLVELDYQRGGSDFYNFMQMQEDLESLVHRKVDLVSAKGLSKHVAPYVDADKILIYERAH